MQITNRELRCLLTNIRNQDMTVRELRKELFDIPHFEQDKEIVDNGRDFTIK